jgi:hypothetical protein
MKAVGTSSTRTQKRPGFVQLLHVEEHTNPKPQSTLHPGGKLVEMYSWAQNLPIIISIAGKYPLSAEAKKFFELASHAVKEAGFSLEFRLLNKN